MPSVPDSTEIDASVPIDRVPTGETEQKPTVIVRIQPTDCGKCFELVAEANGGEPPYEFEWEDGTARARRIECVAGSTRTFTVVARDSRAMRSEPQFVSVKGAEESACTPPAMPREPEPRSVLCLENMSFEGEPAANFGQSDQFDAAPWNACTNPQMTNTPNIGNASVAETLGFIPDPTDGDTFLALGEGEQVSQQFCGPLLDDAPIYVEFDLGRLNIGAGLVPETEQVFLEVWGGLTVNCSVHSLLWASPPLPLGWKTYCATLRPRSFMTQLTLRANADATLPTPAYLVVDNMRQVDSCP